MKAASPDYCDFSAGPWPYCERRPTTVFWSRTPTRKLCGPCFQGINGFRHPRDTERES